MIREKRNELETSFLNSLEDIITIAEKLGEHCESVTDLVDMLKLASTNQGQLRLLMSCVTQGGK